MNGDALVTCPWINGVSNRRKHLPCLLFLLDGAKSVTHVFRQSIFCIQKRPAYVFPAGKSRRYEMAMKKKKGETMKKPTPVKSPARKKSLNGITPTPASCNPTGTGKTVRTILDRARDYFIPAKKIWTSVPHSEGAVKIYQQRPFLQSCYWIRTGNMSTLQDSMSRGCFPLLIRYRPRTYYPALPVPPWGVRIREFHPVWVYVPIFAVKQQVRETVPQKYVI